MNKIVIALSLVFSFHFSLAAEVGQSADEVLATFQNRQARELLGKIPDNVYCGKVALPLKNGIEEKAYVGVWLSNDGSSVAVILPEDGEQEHGYIINTSDLMDLKTGKSSEINADTFSGYWWSDGDHGTYNEPVKCSLMQ